MMWKFTCWLNSSCLRLHASKVVNMFCKIQKLILFQELRLNFVALKHIKEVLEDKFSSVNVKFT